MNVTVTPMTLPNVRCFCHTGVSPRRSASELPTVALPDLTLSELSVLCDFEDELARRGHFTCIFPTKSSHVYAPLFDGVRYVPGASGPAPAHRVLRFCCCVETSSRHRSGQFFISCIE